MIPKPPGTGLASLQDEIDKVARAAGKIDAEKAGFASTMFDALKAQIREFERGLTAGEETAAWLANFGSSMTLTVTSVGYRHPHLIVLVGEDESGRRRELLQHVSQVSLLLVAVAVKQDKAPRRIGFQRPDDQTPEE